MARRQLFGEGKHGEDDQEHGDGAQEKAAPPERRKTTDGFVKATENRLIITQGTHIRAWGSLTDAHAYLPVANKARVTLVDVDYSFGVDVEANEDASQQVASCRSQGSHHIHDGWKRNRQNQSETFTTSNTL